jgi:Kdo2-lipid IVA lauroyltransferase/acyltransferase
MSASPRRAGWRRIRARLGAGLVAALQLLLRPVGWRATQRLGALLGRVVHRLAARERRRALDHLAIAFPASTAAEHRRLARACFAHLGTSLLECLKLSSMPLEAVARWASAEGWDVVEELRRTGRPILFLTAHCGNWELLSPVTTLHGVRITAFARQQDVPAFDRLTTRLRAHLGAAATISRGAPGAARELLRALRSGGALAMLIDQDTKVEGTWVPFFGRPAFTPLGAAQIALRSNMAVVPAFCERLADGTHRVTFHAALDLPADATAATALMTAAIEAQIRRRPEQWVWMHRRWRRQPASG